MDPDFRCFVRTAHDGSDNRRGTSYVARRGDDCGGRGALTEARADGVGAGPVRDEATVLTDHSFAGREQPRWRQPRNRSTRRIRGREAKANDVAGANLR